MRRKLGMTYPGARFTTWLLLGLAVGCGGGGSGGTTTGPDAGSHTGPLLPLKEGNSWTYRVTDNGVVTTKVGTVGALEPVGIGPHQDIPAFKVTTTKDDNTDQAISWQALEGDRALRYREQAFSKSTGALKSDTYWDPYRLHADGSAAHTASGASWLEAYAETQVPADGSPAATKQVTEHWTVEQVGASVTVPAGSYSDAIIFTRAASDSSTTKSYWYVRGIGKVKETGGQTEELASYEVVP
jgi:hypothetical protein